MAESTFLYVTYIRTTPEALWRALTDPAFIPQYWLGTHAEAEWRVGGPWKLWHPDGELTDSGEIVEFEPPRRLAIKWKNEFRPELAAEGWSHCLFELEPEGEAVRLTVTHSIPVERSKLVQAVAGGWPKVLSNLKSLLETGKAAVSRTPATAAA
jgi:uncharacterized protein YndB with AHSA1/START domain